MGALDTAEAALGRAVAAINGAAAPNSAVGLYNFKPSNTAKIRKALTETLNGISQTIIAESGDSTTAGVADAIGGGTSYALSPMAQLAQELKRATYGALTPTESSFGNMAFSDATLLANFDTRVVRGAGWVQGVGSIAGYTEQNSTTTNARTYTFTCDTFDIYYLRNTTFGTFSWAIDGGSATNVSAAGSNSIQKLTVSAGSAGSHTLSLARVSGDIYIVGVEGRVAAAPGVGCWNWGASGKTSAWFADSGASSWQAIQALGYFKPHLLILNQGINDRRDANGPVALATTVANLQIQITTQKPNGDVILLDPVASDTAANVAPADRQAAMSEAFKALALQNDIPFVSLPERFGNYATANAAGLMSDTLHPNVRVHGDRARMIARKLLSL